MVMMVAPTAGRRTMRKSRIRAGVLARRVQPRLPRCVHDRGVAGTSKPCGLMNVRRTVAPLTRRVRVGNNATS